ncbi:MAG TPA: CHAD domain-containing protein [Phycisphaerae bacterium]|nr:CHAD domain-containing protein [Phycisphaerae bacterium]
MADFAKPIASHLLEYVEKQLKRLTGKVEKVRETGEADAVHDLRVASRRLTAPLRIMGAYIGEKKIERIVRDLQRVRGAFRDTRDLDVVQSSLVAPGPSPLEPTSLARLEGYLTRKRERSLRDGRKKTERIDIDRLESDVRNAVQQFQEALDELPEDNIHTLALDAVSKWSGRLTERDPRNPETSHLHETRLCVKRLRYASELLRDLEGRTEDALISALAEVQELLGQWNDHLVAACMLSRLSRKTCSRGEDPAWAGRLLAYAATRADAAVSLRTRIVEVWPTVAKAQSPGPREPAETDMSPAEARG